MTNRDNSYDQRNQGRDGRGDNYDERDRDGGEGGEEGEDDRSRLMPEGRYRGRRIEHELAWAGKGTNAQKEQLAVLFEFLTPEVKGRTMTWYGYFTDKTFESTIKAMRTMGWKGNDPLSGWPDAASKDNPDVELVVNHERNQKNRWISRIRWVNGGGIAVRDVMTPSDKATFAQKVTGIAARLAANEGNAGNGGNDRQLPDRRGGNEPPPPSDDDAPPFQRGRNGGRGNQNRGGDRW